jgi:hypothetical protein
VVSARSSIPRLKRGERPWIALEDGADDLLTVRSAIMGRPWAVRAVDLAPRQVDIRIPARIVVPCRRHICVLMARAAGRSRRIALLRKEVGEIEGSV